MALEAVTKSFGGFIAEEELAIGTQVDAQAQWNAARAKLHGR